MRNMSKKTWKLRVWNHMTEMQKLDILLKHAKVPHTYDPKYFGSYNEQIVVYNSEGQRMWDAICFHGTFSLSGSYGAEQGLVEVMGAQLLGHDVEGSCSKCYYENLSGKGCGDKKCSKERMIFSLS